MERNWVPVSLPVVYPVRRCWWCPGRRRIGRGGGR